MKIDEFAKLVKEKFGSVPFTRYEAETELGASHATVSYAVRKLRDDGALFSDDSASPELLSFKPTPREGARAYALKRWRETFGEELFTASQAARAVGFSEKWTRCVLNKEEDEGRISFSKSKRAFSFAKLKIGRPLGSKDPLLKPIVKVSAQQWEHVRRIDALKAEFPPPCVFDAEGAADLLGIRERAAKSFLYTAVKNHELVKVGEGVGSAFRFPR